MIASALLVVSSVLVGSVPYAPFTRVVVNGPGTKVIHVTSPTTNSVTVNDVAIPLYAGTTAANSPDADVDTNGNYVVAWRASILIGGVSYTTICLSINSGPAIIATDAGGSPVQTNAEPRVTTGHAPAGSTMPITVTWAVGGGYGGNTSVYVQTFTGTPATSAVAKWSQPTVAHPVYYYCNYVLGDISSGDNGDFVVTYIRYGTGGGGPIGVIAHGATYSSTPTDRFPERIMTEGGGDHSLGRCEVACYYDASFVVAYGTRYLALNSESFTALGVPVAATVHHGDVLGMWATDHNLALDFRHESEALLHNISLACQRSAPGYYVVSWSTSFSPPPALQMLTYASNCVTQKVKAYVPQGVVFRTSYDDSAYMAGYYGKASFTSVALTNNPPNKLYLDYVKDEYAPGQSPSLSAVVKLNEAF